MAIIIKYKAKVENILNPIPDIYTVTFLSNKKFKYLPGQFLHLALDSYDGVSQWPESRCFSMQTNPEEELAKITFTKKGNFTKRMASELQIGKEVWIKMPYGDIFNRGHNKNNCVFVSGGTGITTFLSLFTDKSFSGYVKPILYAGFRNREYNIFNTELTVAKNQNNEFEIKIIYQDKNGMLDIEKIYENQGKKTFILSGPTLMLKKFKNYLIQKGLIEFNIITDDWE